jgi:hypothetical protein
MDDGTGERTVWRVEKFQLVPVPDKLQGVFFSGDCYVVKYTYLAGGTEKYLIYYWLVGCLMLPRLKISHVLNETSIKSMVNFRIQKNYTLTSHSISKCIYVGIQIQHVKLH